MYDEKGFFCIIEGIKRKEDKKQVNIYEKNEINKGNEKENYREKALFNGDSKKKLRKRINKIK